MKSLQQSRRTLRAAARILALCMFAFGAWMALAEAERGSAAVVLRVQGAIGPATADYIHSGFEKASETNAAMVVLQIDTPGGLDTAMRDIIRDILASEIPVAVYVAPSGARAASAGTYILYASHVAAMAPGTNLGAATPVQIGGMPEPGDIGKPPDSNPEPKDKAGGPDDAADDARQAAGSGDAMHKKVVNDAVAYIRGLARLRGRNIEWAERAVREAASLPAHEALEQNVADLIAKDLPDLLQQIDGREVKVRGEPFKIRSKDLALIEIEPDWRQKLLAVITDPNVAYILMMIGVYGLFFEFANPGYVVPGVAGAICLVLALYAFQVLPINYAGLGLMLLGVMFMLAEAFVPSFGALGIGGVIAFIIGSVILMETDVEGYGISMPLILSIALTSALFFIGAVGMALRARRAPVVSGREEMIGMIGEAIEDIHEQGRVRVHGEIWKARATAPVRKGQRVRVTALDGLVVTVEPQTEG